ncbi:MAG: 50S ribosomal protein L9 [Synergistaceae bacterium]|nr:50S ribosomal protein L9 [Synergistaceae bacterium]
MKVILKQDVNKLGAAGDLVETSAGYARNYLFPRSLAEEATPDRIKKWKVREESNKKREQKLKDEAAETAKKLAGKLVRVQVSAGEKGKLFGSVTGANVAENITSQLGITVDKRDIRLAETVKQTGSYPFFIRLYTGIEAEMTLVVEGE